MAARRWLWRAALAVVIPVALAVLLVKWRVAVTLDRWIEQAQPVAQVSRGRSFVGLDGAIGVDQIAVSPNQPDVGSVRIERVTLHTPGLWWLVRNGVFGAHQLPQKFGLSIDGLDTSLLEIGADQPALLGQASAAAFDHAGCQDQVFSEGELLGLGLPRETPRIFARYEIAGDGTMRIDTGIERAGAGTTSLAVRLRLAGTATPDAAALMGAAFESIDLSLRDEGFISARNDACAERLKLGLDDFILAHVAMAQRIARALGIELDAVWWDAYAGYAREGGTLDLVGTPQRPVSLLGLQRASGPTGLLLNWQVSRDDGSPRQVEIASITPQPLDGGKPLSLVAQLEAENAAERARLAGGAAPAAPATAPIETGSAPTAGASSGTTPTPPPAAVAVAGPWLAIDYAGLSGHEGAQLRVETVNGTHREGRLERWNPAGMVLRLGPKDGQIPLSLTPRDLRSIQIREQPVAAG